MAVAAWRVIAGDAAVAGAAASSERDRGERGGAGDVGDGVHQRATFRFVAEVAVENSGVEGAVARKT